MKKEVSMLINTPISIVTPISYNNCEATFFIYTDRYEICFSIKLIQGTDTIEFLNDLRNRIIDEIFNGEDTIELYSNDIYYQVEGTDELHSIGISINYLQSSINPSIPILNGLK